MLLHVLLAAALAVLARAGFAAALLPLSSLLLGLAGLSGVTVMTLARGRVAALQGAPALISRAARRPQAALVPSFAVGSIACAVFSRDPPGMAGQAMVGWVLAASAAGAFSLLLAERHVLAAPETALPEARALSRMLTVPVAVVGLSGLLFAARTAGLRGSEYVSAALAIAVAAIAAELSLRALGRWFLPPPDPASARAAVDSALLRAARRTSREGLAAPLRDHFGLDFSRSWALAYARAAVLPLGFALLFGTWLLSGLVVVPADRRAVEERFGAPAAVLAPGLHVIPPWPLGRAIPVEFGPVHEVALAGAESASERAPAEAPAPASADRLWDKAHPSELTFLVASESGGRQEFQIVNADMRVAYRVGLTDEDAIRVVTATRDPEELVRAAAGRAVGAALAERTLWQVLGERREALAETLRLAAQRELDDLGTGLQVVAMVIEAIHPPPGAADAYHAVQAAEIRANTAISTERGRAQAALAMARQQAATSVDVARGAAAELVSEADARRVQFAADRDAATAGGRAFLLERYFQNVVAALAGSPKTILDSRLGAGEPTVVDLRPLVPGSAAAKED